MHSFLILSEIYESLFWTSSRGTKVKFLRFCDGCISEPFALQFLLNENHGVYYMGAWRPYTITNISVPKHLPQRDIHVLPVWAVANSIWKNTYRYPTPVTCSKSLWSVWSMNLFNLNMSTNYMSRIFIYVTISHLIPVSYLGCETFCNILGLCELYFLLGRAIAQAVIHWLPAAAARVRSRVWSSGFCDGQNGSGAGVLRVLRFLLPIFIPPNSPSS
jgi:hypothetical protein